MSVPQVGNTDAIVGIFGWAYNAIEDAGVESWGWRSRCGSAMLLRRTSRTDGGAVVHPGKDSAVVGSHGGCGNGNCR